jgi:hypothetical protein
MLRHHLLEPCRRRNDGPCSPAGPRHTKGYDVAYTRRCFTLAVMGSPLNDSYNMITLRNACPRSIASIAVLISSRR